MSVLIPVISKKENSKEFLQKALSGQKEVFLLGIMDTGAVAKNFGLAASEIGRVNEIIEEIKKELKEKGIKFDDALEWGDTQAQIINFAKLKKVRKVILAKQENKYFEDLVKKLKDNGFDMEIFEEEKKPEK